MKSEEPGEHETTELDRLRARLAETEAALRRQQDLVQLISDTASAGILTFDLEGRMVSANSWAEEFLGLTRDEITGRTYNDPRWHLTDLEGCAFPDEDLPFVQVLATEKPVPDVCLGVDWPDGRRVFLSVNTAPMVDPAGHTVGVLCVFKDITEQIASQQQLEASETRYRNLFNSMQDAFSLQEIIHDEHGNACDYRFLEVNPAFEALTGIPADQWIGRTVKEVLPATEPHWIQLCGEVARTGFPTRVEHYSEAFDRYYEVLAYRPAPNQCAALSTDVTDRKHAEESLLQKSRLDATATLAGGVAHDLNNLMVGVLGNADLLRRMLSHNSEAIAMLSQIADAGQQAGRLAQQLLSFSRPIQPKTEIVDLAAAIDETLRIQHRSIPPRITVERTAVASLWKIEADPSQMVQVLMNLCLNAAEAIDGNGKIQIHAENAHAPDDVPRQQPDLPPGRYVLLSVHDNGHGLDPAVRDRIFEPFFSTKQQGRGLGLAAAHGIVKSHGGAIVVSSQPNNGTTFDVYLPATDEAPVTKDVDADAALRGTETILLIDDELMVLRIVSNILGSLGYTILTADSGKAAVQVANEYDGTIHAAFLDLGMPVMGGKETFPLLRQARPEMKIIICSGYDQKGDVEALLAAGAEAFVSKPFTVEDLIPPMRAALDG